MTQQTVGDFNINPATDSGTLLAEILNRMNEVLLTMRSGPNRPADALSGTLWLSTNVSHTPYHNIMYYDGSSDLALVQINPITHALTIPYADDTFLAIIGGTLTGALSITKTLNLLASTGNTELIFRQASGQDSIIKMYRTGAGALAGTMTHDSATDFITLASHDVSGNVQTSIQVKSASVDINQPINATSVHATNGFTGTFPDNNGATVTVVDGIITSVV